MKNLPLRISWILFIALLFGIAGVFEVKAETLGYLKVVSTTPVVRSKVDSSLSEITISFSHPMKHGSYSFQPVLDCVSNWAELLASGGKESFDVFWMHEWTDRPVENEGFVARLSALAGREPGKQKLGPKRKVS